jgi:predicted Na+-dependent transporter
VAADWPPWKSTFTVTFGSVPGRSGSDCGTGCRTVGLGVLVLLLLVLRLWWVCACAKASGTNALVSAIPSDITFAESYSIGMRSNGTAQVVGVA